jgi:methionyl-tRNA formyltransferase
MLMNNQKPTFIVAGVKSWHRRVFDEIIQHYPGAWMFIAEKEQLDADYLVRLQPRYIFFLHWSWIVPNEIIDKWECVCFHMTDVPYGRGGSPLQNLIVRGHRETKLTALRMVTEVDAGPIYIQEPLGLEGSAEEIYIRASYLSARMIRHLIENEPTPVPQSGEVVTFKRRTPAESEITNTNSLQHLYDFIRMLDAQGYPHAFLEHEGFRFEFTRAALYNGRIVADVTITAVEKPEE